MPDLTAIEPDMAVFAPDGPVGRVESVVVSPRTGAVARLLVEPAYRPGRLIAVPAEWVAVVEGWRVGLERPRGEALALPLQRRNPEGWLQPARPEPAPDYVHADDAATRTAVRRALSTDTLTADGAVEVSVSDGVVELRGRVRTAAGAFQARRLALETAGVWHVRADLFSDEALVVEVRRRLQRELPPAAPRFEISADLGRLTLRAHGVGSRGDVARAADDLEAARALAAGVPGVDAVDVTTAG